MDSLPIRLIVGLGNPGSDYQETRHNAGFWFADGVARRWGSAFRSDPKFHAYLAVTGIAGSDRWLLKPATFMNRSGQAVAGLARYFRLQPCQILVAHDELDLPPGVVRIKYGGGHAGHNGLRDIVAALGDGGFYRLRIGIGHPGDSRLVVGYVLSRPSRADRQAIEGGLDEAVEALPEILSGEIQRAMNRLHARPPTRAE